MPHVSIRRPPWPLPPVIPAGGAGHPCQRFRCFHREYRGRRIRRPAPGDSRYRAVTCRSRRPPATIGATPTTRGAATGCSGWCCAPQMHDGDRFLQMSATYERFWRPYAVRRGESRWTRCQARRSELARRSEPAFTFEYRGIVAEWGWLCAGKGKTAGRSPNVSVGPSHVCTSTMDSAPRNSPPSHEMTTSGCSTTSRPAGSMPSLFGWRTARIGRSLNWRSSSRPAEPPDSAGTPRSEPNMTCPTQIRSRCSSRWLGCQRSKSEESPSESSEASRSWRRPGSTTVVRRPTVMRVRSRMRTGSSPIRPVSARQSSTTRQ